MSFPVHIQAFQVIDKTKNVFDMDLEWKFGNDIPKRLFEVSDVTSREALEWYLTLATICRLFACVWHDAMTNSE